MTDTIKLIAELKDLEAKATPGPWDSWLGEIKDESADGFSIGECKNTYDAMLIVAMRNALPGLIEIFETPHMLGRLEKRALLARVERAEAEVERQLAEADDEIDMWSIALRTTEARAERAETARDELRETLKTTIPAGREKVTELLIRAEQMQAERDVLAEAAADRACPANGYITCDNFLNAGGKCQEVLDDDYRKKCWLEAAERIAEARAEAARERTDV